MKNRTYLYDVILVLAGAIVIALDQWSKAAVRQHFGVCDTGAYIPFQIVKHLNHPLNKYIISP